MNAAVLLELIGDLYQQLVQVGVERDDLAAQVADLRKHLDECPANQDPPE